MEIIAFEPELVLVDVVVDVVFSPDDDVVVEVLACVTFTPVTSVVQAPLALKV